MNIKQIRELAQIVSQSGLSALEVEEGEVRVRLERSVAAAPCAAQMESGVAAAQAIVENAAPAQPAPAPHDAGVDFNRATDIKSSLVGVFYAAPSPDAKPYVEVGSKVKKGDVLCIIEAMKLMNEIVAEQDGEIVDICVRNGDFVEFGQTLFNLL